MWLSAALLLTMILTLDSSKSLYWSCTMTHQVLKEYNSLPTTNHKQGATKLLKLLNKYSLLGTFENGENYSIQF